MRYPGGNRQQRFVRSIIFLIALLLFFGASTLAVKKKFVLASYLRPKPTPTFAGQPTTSPTGLTILKLHNSLTGEPIRNQSIAFISTGSCNAATLSCPTSTPTVITTDETGSVPVAQTLLLDTPKLYAAGYKTERYFTFVSDRPTVATVYYPPAGAKTNYDISLEPLYVGLQPVAE